MAKSDNGAQHVGGFIRRQVIPVGMSVTEAARRLGVGRAALSSLLNGRAALSQNMALRLEATFGADRARLLELQAVGDRERRSVEDRAVAVGTYAPSFLTIEARQVEEWAARNIAARDRLPVLLRRLVHATGRELRRVDFPGYDNAQRHGWDGQVEADAATLWVPKGRSFWEFGVDQRPKVKANSDYRARVGALPPGERANCTFVFVTPRNWSSKDEWVRGKETTGDWKAVKAIDASDLEQWLENTIAPRIWLAGELGLPTEGFETLDRFWKRWAEASDPPMTDATFAPSVAVHLERFTTWLKKKPADGPLTVAADSREEAVAFLACLFRHGDVPAPARDHAVVFESAGTLRNLEGSPSPFIPIVYREDTERELVSHYRQRHCIAVRLRNAVDREPDVVVELLGHEAFTKALTDMGVTERDRVDQLASESGRSPTVLRRRLSRIPETRTPSWAGDSVVARSLIPLALVGAWHKGSPADCEALAKLAGCRYDQIENNIADLLQFDDCPVWCVDQYRGVVSKIDALFAIGRWMTADDVSRFLNTAKDVLSEPDPTLELPPERRWAAGLHGKVREHSRAMRTGVCETLAMLSVHGNGLFRERLGIHVAGDVATVVQCLLTPFTSDKLRSHDRDLAGYAEAAPNEFLELLEEDLKQPQPVLNELLRPVSVDAFDHPWRTGILWALESLAWNPQTFPRVVIILARLSETQIDDNWVNRPINSLSAMFRWWMPQTAASLNDRIKALEVLCRRFPEVGWQVCIQQFEGRHRIGSYSARPRWRSDAAGAGQPRTGSEPFRFVRKALDLAIQWPIHTIATIGDLIDRLGTIADSDRLSVWHSIDTWSRTEEDEGARATLRERIRLVFLTRRGFVRGLSAVDRVRAREIWGKLAPHDPVRRHAWLFARPWVECSTDELDDEDVGFKEREAHMHQLRSDAMRDIWSSRGLDGALDLLTDCDGWTLGRYAALCAGGEREAIAVLRACLSPSAPPNGKLDDFMGGFLRSVDEDLGASLVSGLAGAVAADQVVRLFKCAPFCERMWRLLDQQDRVVRGEYWRVVHPGRPRLATSEIAELIDCLLEVERPRAAFCAVQFDWAKVETSRLKRLLMAVGKGGREAAGDFEIEPYSLSEALGSLDGRTGVTRVEMAQLEFAFIEALDRSEHGIPNLERQVAESPALFVQALARFSKRDDDGQDPVEWRVDDPQRSEAVGGAAYRLLESATRLPGADDQGKIDPLVLSRWVTETRRLCEEHGRAGIGDNRIGQLLSRGQSDEDGGWPCRGVCEVLETVGSQDMVRGFEIGVFNARGVHSRGLEEGGEQERTLAAKYRAYAERLVFDYPYVANILERIAKDYDRDAEREDLGVLARRRLER